MALEDGGQAGTDLAPNDPFDDLVALLRDDPTSDVSTDAAGREPSPRDVALQTQDNDDGEGDPDLVSDEQIGQQQDDDPDVSLSPNRSRAPLASRTQREGSPTARQGRTFQVTVKGEDGADQKIEVDENERGAGYLRHGQFTRLTQELSTQRAQVMEVADRRIRETTDKALESVQRAQAIIVRLAGFLSPAEMHKLAIENPQHYAAEQARVSAVQAEIKALDDEAAAILKKREESEQAMLAEGFRACWSELVRLGLAELDANGNPTPEAQAKLKRTFEEVMKHYGIPAARFVKINDPKLIHMMFDAVELRDAKARLESKTAKELRAAPRMPQKRQHQPQQTRVSRDLDGRFARPRGGSQNDLANWLVANNL